MDVDTRELNGVRYIVFANVSETQRHFITFQRLSHEHEEVLMVRDARDKNNNQIDGMWAVLVKEGTEIVSKNGTYEIIV